MLNEDPWERIRVLKRYFKKTPLAMALRAQSLVGHRHYPDDVSRAFVAAAASNGIDVFRAFDALNDYRNFEAVFSAVRSAGKHFQGCICYSLTEPRMGGDVFTRDYYVEKAKALDKMGVDSICIKDMAGMLAPYDGHALIRDIKGAVAVPVHLHSHFTSGMAPMTHLKAIEAGVDVVDTCLSAYAYHTSHPAAEPLVMSLLGTNRDTGLSLPRLAQINGILKRDILPKYESLLTGTGGPAIHADVLSSQVPPGMSTYIEQKLKDMDATDRIDRVYEELPAVRRDLGQVPLVTPIYQIVATQAVNNVLFDSEGERYAIIADHTKDLCFGCYGKTPGPIDPDLVERALKDYAMGPTPTTGRPGEVLDPELEKAKRETVDLAAGPEDEVLYALFPVSGKQFLKWKYGKEEPPPSTKPKTLTEAGAELEMIGRVKAGEAIESTALAVPGKGEGLRTFNVFVDDEYFEVGVEEAGGRPEVSYVRSGSSPTLLRPTVPANTGPVVADKPPMPPSAPVPPSSPTPSPAQPVGGVGLVAPMPGTIVSYEKEVGDIVSEGETVVILEAMKMENALPAPASGTIKSIDFSNGDSVAKGDVLCVIG